MALTERKRRFVKEYLIDLNATQAAIRAGYSEKTAYSQGQRLLKDVEINGLIQKEQQKRAETLDITKDRIVEELAKIAFGDVREIVNWTQGAVMLIPSKEITDKAAAAISEVSKGAFGIKIKRHDKVRALDSLTKLLGFDKESGEEAIAIEWEEP